MGKERKGKMNTIQRQRLKRFVAVYVLVAVVLTALIVVGSIGKAHATCVRSGDTCPSPAAMAKKFRHGFYHKAHGIDVHKAFRAPKAARRIFAAKYVKFYKRHPKLRGPLGRHAAHLNRRTSKAFRAGGTPTCQSPITPQCMAVLEWKNSIINSNCVGWHSFPSLFDHAACNRFIESTSNQEFLTKKQMRNGLLIGACAVGSGAAIVLAVGSGGSAAPLLAAGAASTGCVATIWEVASP